MSAAMESTVDELTAAAKRLGWRIEFESLAGTGSRYYAISKLLAPDLHDDCGTCDCELIVRIADHGSAYEKEDYDLSPGGHTMAQVVARLERGPICSECGKA